MRWKTVKPLLNLVHYSIFGLWNLCFLVVLYLMWLPEFGVETMQAIASGEIQREFAITLIGFLAIPPICTAIAYTKLLKQPLAQTRLFFGIEAPLFVLCLLRFFVLRELNPASFWLLGSLLVAIATFSVTQITGYWGDRDGLPRRLAPLQAAAQTLVILMGVYVGVLLMLYVVPVAGFVLTGLVGWITSEYFWTGLGESWQWFWANLTQGSLDAVLQSLFFTALFGLSVVFFLAMPMSFILFYVDSGRGILRKFAAQRGRKTAMMLAVATLTAWIAIASGLNRQPQHRAFAFLDRDISSPQARQALLENAPAIRDGLLNAYLHPYRYLGTNQDTSNIEWLYQQSLRVPDGVAHTLQEFQDLLLFAFLYNGDRNENDRASELYAQFFDTPIQKGEQAAILKSLKSTTMLDAANAGVLNIGEEKVHLDRQDLTITPAGDWAEVELHEVYVNQTFEVEEIFYSFSLPESAVITGIWLGETETLSDRFPFQVSPRGAAQAVYNSQVQRERPIDPALLEQVGPRNYRLRAFPIPAQPDQWERNNGVEPAKFHLWLTYRTLRSANSWPLPQLSEARNVFWDDTTARFRNGEAVPNIPTWFEAQGSAPDGPLQPQTATLAGYTVTAEPLADLPLREPQGKRLAIVLDSSYSMNEQRQELAKTVQWIEKHGLTDGDLANNEADFYVATAAGIDPYAVPRAGIPSLDRTPFYGTVQLKTMVRQFAQLRDNTPYDAVILLSDRGSYELADDSDRLPALEMPLWTVHLGNHYPAAYDDAILAAIQTSGGGAAGSIQEMLYHMTELSGQPITLADGYRWEATPTDNPTATPPDGFTPFAARFLIHHLSRETDTTDPEQLDKLHAIATETAIVTPYSSMIVLVNDEQRNMLKEAEQGEDRFNRTVEDGNEDLQEPPSVMGNTTVPEPGTWLAALIITLLIIRQRRHFAR
jgi:putative PEP-CTERM system integral membrane protein